MMTIKELKEKLSNVPSKYDEARIEVVGEVCFGKHHGLDLCHAGMGQEDKFVLFFKERK